MAAAAPASATRCSPRHPSPPPPLLPPLAGGAMEGALLRDPWLKARELVHTEIFADSDDISRVVAAEIAALIRQRQAEGAPRGGKSAGRAGLGVRPRAACGQRPAPRSPQPCRPSPPCACRAAVRAGAGHGQHPHARLQGAGPPAQVGAAAQRSAVHARQAAAAHASWSLCAQRSQLHTVHPWPASPKEQACRRAC